MAVARVTAWAAEERTRLQPVQPHRADQFAKILAELPQYASNEWDAFNERALLPLLRRLKEGSIGRKPREPDATGLRREVSGASAAALQGHVRRLVDALRGLHDDAPRLCAELPSRATRVAKLLQKQCGELQKLLDLPVGSGLAAAASAGSSSAWTGESPSSGLGLGALERAASLDMAGGERIEGEQLLSMLPPSASQEADSGEEEEGGVEEEGEEEVTAEAGMGVWPKPLSRWASVESRGRARLRRVNRRLRRAEAAVLRQYAAWDLTQDASEQSAGVPSRLL